ncbi:site-specific integrase [Alphaproteobacteria bacterium]|nr:site-specific integrase [Alphaproteobacteria bacterium]
MSKDGDILDLFDEMLLVEKQLSNNTRRAYKSDINLYIEFIHAKYNLSILDVDSKKLTSWSLICRVPIILSGLPFHNGNLVNRLFNDKSIILSIFSNMLRLSIFLR